MEGIVKISKEDEGLYLNFDHIGVSFDNDTIYMQNSGNAMNPYIHFKECDDMYIHLAKKINLENMYSAISNKKKSTHFTDSQIENLLISEPITKNNVDMYNNLAYHLSCTKNGNQQAINILTQVTNKFPERVVAYLNLADNYWNLGEKEKAVKNYNMYISLMKSQKKDLSRIPQSVWERIK